MANTCSLASSCHSLCAKYSTSEMDTFCNAGGMRKKAAGREENGYLYLLALELPTQIPGGFLTQCSTN